MANIFGPLTEEDTLAKVEGDMILNEDVSYIGKIQEQGVWAH